MYDYDSSQMFIDALGIVFVVSIIVWLSRKLGKRLGPGRAMRVALVLGLVWVALVVVVLVVALR
jgi:amino acid permease